MNKQNINRLELLHYLPSGIVAEIGVAKGDFSRCIMDIVCPNELYLIDVWDSLSMSYPDKTMVNEKRQQKRYNAVKNYFRKFKEVEIIREKSDKSASLFPDNYFDWVYIDADHSYQGCYNDLKSFNRKVKKNGYICGHDWLAEGYYRKGFGVNDAVKDFVKENNYSLALVTNEDKYASYVIAKTQEAKEIVMNKLS